MGEGLLSIGYSLYQVKFVPDFKDFIPCPVKLEKISSVLHLGIQPCTSIRSRFCKMIQLLLSFLPDPHNTGRLREIEAQFFSTSTGWQCKLLSQ